MQRGSDRLSVRRDDEMKHELRELLRSRHPTRSEEWHDPEPTADDDPAVAGGPVTPGRSPGPVESLRDDLARHLGRGSFPGRPRAIARELRAHHASDDLVQGLRKLPGDTTYPNAEELARAVLRRQGEM
ncbi:DUF2795 domain-containing protein [Streptomyces sp. NPDC002004]